jgi:cardiolipin synthase
MPELTLGDLASGALTLLELISLGFIPAVLARRKEPAATFAWIVTLVTLPALGVVLFWYLGRDRVRRPLRARAQVNRALRQRTLDRLRPVDGVVQETRERTLEGGLFADAPEPLRGVMRLAMRTGRAEPVAGNEVEALVGAPRTWAAIASAIDAAQRSVHLEYYAFRIGAAASPVFEALVRAARRGVAVRLLYDAFGSAGLRRRLRPLHEAGGRSAPFFPLDPIRRGATINLRNHRKLVTVDGRVGFAGGINVGDEFAAWRDVHLRIAGPAVRQLEAIFVEDWFFATREDLLDTSLGEVPPAGPSSIQIVQSGPDETLEAIQRLYFAAIAAARERVWITTPYFVPDRAVLVALETAALRGVDVKLLVPERSNWWLATDAGRSFYDGLLGAGVEIHEYLPGMLHTKAMVVDGHFGTVGSANLDVRSFRLNFELLVVLYDPRLVAELEALFRADQQHARRLSLAAWRARPFHHRVREGLGRLLSPLL